MCRMTTFSLETIHIQFKRKSEGCKSTTNRPYRKREFCEAMKCSMFDPCTTHCQFTAWQFHDWLQRNGFTIIKGSPSINEEHDEKPVFIPCEFRKIGPSGDAWCPEAGEFVDDDYCVGCFESALPITREEFNDYE